ncbi:UDP-glycosyltransferase 83A1-like [Salvia splendens]|uniref:UDP-glycosyltransferase 83A1-like n=1 Tax=Salvia splendens TaxID=180675 RepID=UPI001C265AA7|nr:UDP-glycosyltransferase 83A1-like [Salvia splendens]
MGRRAHVVAIPYPAQGHVIPMMELSQRLAKNGVRVTFVNTESNHQRVVEALPPQATEKLLHLVSVSDGLDCWEDRMDFAKSVEALGRVLPAELEALI